MQAAAVGERDRAALAAGGAFAGEQLARRLAVPGEPAGRGGDEQGGQGLDRLAAGVRAQAPVERRQGDGAGQAGEAAGDPLGLGPGGFVARVGGAPGGTGGVRGRIGAGLAQAEMPLGGGQRDLLFRGRRVHGASRMQWAIAWTM